MHSPRTPLRQTETTPTLAGVSETLLVLFCILLMSNALVGPLLDPDQQAGDAMPILRLMWLPVYAATLALVAWRGWRLGRFWKPALLLGLILLDCAASVAWSQQPDVTLRRAVALGFTMLLGFHLAARYDGRALAELLASAFMILAGLSLAACVALPSLGIAHDINAGAWKGLWYEKNELGAMMVYGALACVAAIAAGSTRRKLWAAGLVLCLFLIVMSRSKTSLVSVILALSAVGGLAIMRRGPIMTVIGVWTAVTGAGLAAAALTLAPGALLQALGKDATLTGRTEIWAAIMRQSAHSPLLGFGYAAFWVKDSTPMMFIRQETKWTVPSAHNGWLDLLLQVGWIGVALIGAIFVLGLVFALVRAGRLRDGGWSAAYLLIFAAASASESFFVQQNALTWVLCCAALTRALGPAPMTVAKAAPKAVWRPAWDVAPSPFAVT